LGPIPNPQSPIPIISILVIYFSYFFDYLLNKPFIEPIRPSLGPLPLGVIIE
jgi:hypothetical protein